MSLGDVPEILHVDESQVNNLFSFINEGTIEEVIQTTTSEDSAEAGAGINKIIELRFGGSSTETEGSELKRSVDKIGKFAILYGHLESENDIVNLSYINRDELSQGDFVEAHGNIVEPPIREIRDTFEQFKPIFGMMDEEIDSGDEDLSFEEVDQLVRELDADQNVYRQQSEGTEDRVVFKLSTSGDNSLPNGFPSSFTNYRVLGRVEHIFSRGEEEYLVEIFNKIPDGGHQARQQKDIAIRQFTEAASELLGKSIDESDLKLSYPDIMLRPMAVYIY